MTLLDKSVEQNQKITSQPLDLVQKFLTSDWLIGYQCQVDKERDEALAANKELAATVIKLKSLFSGNDLRFRGNFVFRQCVEQYEGGLNNIGLVADGHRFLERLRNEDFYPFANASDWWDRAFKRKQYQLGEFWGCMTGTAANMRRVVEWALSEHDEIVKRKPMAVFEVKPGFAPAFPQEFDAGKGVRVLTNGDAG